MTEKIQGGEFTDREVQRPPEDTVGSVAQGSATASAQADLAETPIGAPPACFDVRSIYDSRPVNGYDFTITATNIDGENEVPLEFTVRQGFVAVLLGFSHWIEDDPLPPILHRNEILATLTKNGVDVQDNIDVPVGLFSDNLWTGFIIADEFETLGVRLVFEDPLLDVGQQWVTFRGNYILKTGRAANFEIANPSNAPGCGLPPPPEFRPQPQPVMVQRRYLEPPPPPVAPVVTRPVVMPAPAPVVRPHVLHSGGQGGKPRSGGGVRTGPGVFTNRQDSAPKKPR